MHQIFNIFLADGQLLIYVVDAVSPSIRYLWLIMTLSKPKFLHFGLRFVSAALRCLFKDFFSTEVILFFLPCLSVLYFSYFYYLLNLKLKY